MNMGKSIRNNGKEQKQVTENIFPFISRPNHTELIDTVTICLCGKVIKESEGIIKITKSS